MTAEQTDEPGGEYSLPSETVQGLADAWGSSEPMLLAQVVGLARWVSAACKDVDPADRVSLLTRILGLTRGRAIDICQVAACQTE